LYDDETSTHLASDEVILKMKKSYNLTPEISKVYCRGVEAGMVSKINYDPILDHTTVTIKLFKKFRVLANEKAYFWIVKPTLKFDKVEGLDTIVRGNYINFVSSDPEAKEKSTFNMHEEKPQIKGVHVKLLAKDIESLSEGAGLFYRNVEIGLINNYTLNADKKSFTIDLIVLKKYRNLLNTSSLFYHNSGIEFKADYSGIRFHTGSAETLLRGGIAVITPNFKASSNLKKSYKLYKSQDSIIKAKYLVENGLHLNLLANRLGSLKKGSPIFFKQIKVGEVLSYKWNGTNKQVVLSVFIIEEYAKEVQENTLFYNASGIRAKMNLNGLEVDTESIETIMAGGIAFFTPSTTETRLARNKMQFELYHSKELALENFIDITLICEDSAGLEEGSPLKYKNVILGHVQKIELKGNNVSLHLKVEAKYKDLIKKDTVFWLETFEFGLSGVKNVSSAIKGPYIVLKPGVSQESFSAHYLMPKSPIPHFKEEGLRVIVHARRLGGLKAGLPVYYRQIKIGSVVQHTLNSDATKVGIEIFIEPCYAHLVRNNSYVYNTSGIGMEISLFGAKMKTESMESILAGGIGILTPDDFEDQSLDGQSFELHDDFNADYLQWSPKLHSTNPMCQ
jgi:paraquat-inducible protein B